MPVFFRLLFAFLLLPVHLAPAAAAAYIPASDATILEHLPFKPNDKIARELRQMRAQLQRNPRHLEVAVKLAQRYYSLVAEEGDPRYLGYAQAALTPWWELPQPPLEVQLLRAALAQFRHDFSGALRDLNDVLERDPAQPQARVSRAVIQIVQARYELARTDCLALRPLTSALIADGCSAMVDGLTGKAASAYAMLESQLRHSTKVAVDTRLWVLLRLAEISQRLGRSAAAEAHFRQALALEISDSFLLAAYADFLLDQQRPAEVVALLQDKSRSDALLLRLLLAERSLGLPDAARHESTLGARYLAAQLRGDTVHQQEEARFALHVQQDPKKALRLAQLNWQVQREPRDARILLEAALTLKDPGAASPVLQWLASSGIEDRYLIRVGQQLRFTKEAGK